jgi:ABC-2 type transport system ATP-binding protein
LEERKIKIMYAIETKELTKHFKTVTAVDNLDLHVPKGSIYGFLGPNGAGKTTTLKMLLGFTTPTAGEAFILGKNIKAENGSFRKEIGYLPDVPSEEFLSFTGELFGLKGNSLKHKVAELLDLSGLTGVKTQIGGFSRGMKQRLGIAQALINDPQVVLMDEPTSALDPIGRKEVLDMISQFKGKTTVMLSTHILSDVERICDTVAILNKGKLVIEESIATLKKKYIYPTILLKVSKNIQQVSEKMAGYNWIVETRLENDTLRIVVTDLETAQKDIPKIVAEMDVGIKDLRIDEATLEDIFVRLVKNA